jgi:lysophospholipase L1-like esterase
MDRILHPEGLEPVTRRLRESTDTTIVALGDSNTCNATFTGGAKQWPELLHAELRIHFATQRVLLVNAGICGDTARGGLARLKTDVLRFSPHLTIVSFGSNDAKKVSREEFGEQINEMVDRLHKGGSAVLLRTAPPVMELEPPPPHIWRVDDAHRELMEVNRQVAVERRLPFVDNFGMWYDLEDQGKLNIASLMHDCVHTNARGHALIARQIAPAFGMPPSLHWERSEMKPERH